MRKAFTVAVPLMEVCYATVAFQTAFHGVSYKSTRIRKQVVVLQK